MKNGPVSMRMLLMPLTRPTPTKAPRHDVNAAVSSGERGTGWALEAEANSIATLLTWNVSPSVVSSRRSRRGESCMAFRRPRCIVRARYYPTVNFFDRFDNRSIVLRCARDGIFLARNFFRVEPSGSHGTFARLLGTLGWTS